jgi:hypothetical protein
VSLSQGPVNFGESSFLYVFRISSTRGFIVPGCALVVRDRVTTQFAIQSISLCTLMESSESSGVPLLYVKLVSISESLGLTRLPQLTSSMNRLFATGVTLWKA